MHIVLGFLGTVVTILWLLHRLAEMGIDLGGLNPWLWRRRRKWKRQFEANPIFSIDSPMEVTALLVTAVAKEDGDLTGEEKGEILTMFENEFHLSKRESAGLLISSSHLLGDGEELRNKLRDVLAPSLDKFTPEQVESALELTRQIAGVGGGTHETQRELLGNISKQFDATKQSSSKWE